MENLKLCFSAILPTLLIVMIGYAAKRGGLIREEDVSRANRWAFNVLMPLMCFYNVYQSDLGSAFQPRLIGFALAAVCVVYALSVVYARRFVPEPGSRSVVAQGLFRSNLAILGVPLCSGLTAGGDVGVVAILTAFVVPFYNVLAVITLERGRGGRVSAGRLALNILRNPLILGSAAGLLFLALGLRLPAVLETPVRDLGKAASPVMLFLLGASFRFRSAPERRKRALTVSAFRLLLIPALALGAAAALGFRGVAIVALLAVFASPTAVSSYTMAEQLGGDAPLAADIVVCSSVLSVLTIFGWSLLLKSLGLF